MFEQLAERWPISPPRMVAIACVLVLAAALGRQALHWRATLSAPVTVNATATVVAAPAQDAALPLILSANLFGAGSAEAAGTRDAAPRASQGFTLRAAFAGAAGKSAGAVIEPAGGSATWVGLNGVLPGNVRLAEVHADHVILDRGGVPEALAFPALDSSLGSSNSPGSSSVTGASADDGATPRPEPIPTNISAEDKARLVRQRLEELRNRARS